MVGFSEVRCHEMLESKGHRCRNGSLNANEKNRHTKD